MNKPYLNIQSGSHDTAKDGMCVMEAVAYFVGEKHTDKPSCTCSVIGRAMIGFNDRFPFKSDAERTETLLPLIPIVVGTAGTQEDRQARAYIMADFAVRVFAPMALEVRGRVEAAATLRALAPIVDKETCLTAKKADAAAAVYAAAAAAAAAAADAAAAVYAAADAAAAAAAAADDAAADAKFSSIREAIKLAFAAMIQKCAAVGVKKLELTVEAKTEFEAACKLVCK